MPKEGDFRFHRLFGDHFSVSFCVFLIPSLGIMVKWNRIWQSFRQWYKKNDDRNESLEVGAFDLGSVEELFGKGR